jgi:hypothetical protein
MTVNQKSAITTMRRKQERRDERMREIRAQTADGTLVIRQMTPAQHDAAGEVARQTRSRIEARAQARRTRGQ